jgi:hypothetical protein
MKNSSIKEMRALSVIQPWAHCIIRKGKNVENRPKITHMRGTIAIHSSAKIDQERFDILKENYGIKLSSDDVSFGTIIGFADVVDVVTKRTLTKKTQKWFVGKYGYVLKNIVILNNPVPVKGALGFWRLRGKSLNACLKQLSARQKSKFIEFSQID